MRDSMFLQELYGHSLLWYEKGADVYPICFNKGNDVVGNLHVSFFCQHSKKVPSAHTEGEAGRRVGSAGSRAGRNVSIMREVGCRAQANKPCWVCAGFAWPSEALSWHLPEVRLGCCKKGQDQAVHCPAQKLFNDSLGLFSSITVLGLGMWQAHRMAKQQLNVERHLERGRVTRRWIKMKCQEKKRMMKRGKSQKDQSRKQASGRSSYWSSC